MKIYIVCDLEGTAGVADQIHQCSFTHDSYDKEYVPGKYGPFYFQARKLATLELNALVIGALEAGATDIWAWDGHCRFPGGLDVELLHPECKLVMNAGDGGPAGLDSSFNAVFMLGLHAKQGAPAAPQAHMLFPGLEWNREPVGEIGMTMATAAVLGVPVVFISGDRAAVHEAQALCPCHRKCGDERAAFYTCGKCFRRCTAALTLPGKSQTADSHRGKARHPTPA